MSGHVWGVPLLVLLVGTGILLTIRLKALQLFMLPHALRETFLKPKSNEQGDISHFQALMVALPGLSGVVVSETERFLAARRKARKGDDRPLPVPAPADPG